MELSQTLEGLTDQQGEILKAMEALTERVETGDTEAKAQVTKLASDMEEITTERQKQLAKADADSLREQIAAHRAEMEAFRSPSKAALIGTRSGSPATLDANPEDLFFWSVWAARNTRAPEYHALGKANLEAMGSYWEDVPAEAKATLGASAAAGGNIIPLNVLGTLIEQRVETNPFRRLMPFEDAGFVTGVDIPTEPLGPTRAVIASAGSTKQNVDLTYGKYTATMYTLARIYDVGNQLLRNSRGVAERNVRSNLTRAMGFGEAYYILQGSGSSEPTGLLTALGTSGTFVTSFTSSATTLAGSSAAAIAKANGDVANRAHLADGVVVNAKDFWIMAAQGTDTAGFFLSPTLGPTAINPTGLEIRLWGLPVYGTTYMPTDSMVTGEWSTTPVYTGQTFRVDVSDVAGTRWDTNETGFRGEEEIAFNATAHVVQGKFQRVVDFTP